MSSLDFVIDGEDLYNVLSAVVYQDVQSGGVVYRQINAPNFHIVVDTVNGGVMFWYRDANGAEHVRTI